MLFYDFFLIFLNLQVYGSLGSTIPSMLVGISGANTPSGTTGMDTHHYRNQPCLHTHHLGSSDTLLSQVLARHLHCYMVRWDLKPGVSLLVLVIEKTKTIYLVVSINHFLEAKIFVLTSNINTVILVTIWALR